MKVFKHLFASLALVLALLPAVAQAQSTVVTIGQGDAVPNIKTAIENALVSNTTVTVTGSKSGTTAALEITIPNGKTVEWQADYSGYAHGNTNGVIVLKGNGGTFEITGGTIENTAVYHAGEDCDAIVAPVHNDKITIIVNGGTVKATGDGAVIYNESGVVEVRSGTVTAKYFLGIIANYNNVLVSGGKVESLGDTGCAIAARNGDIVISNGTVEALGLSGVAIDGGYYGESNIKITGGTVKGKRSGIYNRIGNVEVSNNGKVIALGNGIPYTIGWAIETLDGNVTISDNAEVTSDLTAIQNGKGDVTVNGGTVTANGYAVSAVNGDVEITGGTLKAGWYDVYSGNGLGTYSGNVTISGGTLEADWGAVYNDKGNISVSGNAKVKANGYDSDPGDYGWAIETSNGDVTISDNATVESDKIAIYNSKGKVTVNGGKVTANRWAIDAETNSVAVTINGGTIAGGTTGIFVKTGTVVINGGSITSVNLQPNNSSGANVYWNELTIGGTPQPNTAVTAGSINSVPCADTPVAGSGVYGIKGVKTDNDGKVYFWLPVSGSSGADAEEITVAASGNVYRNTFRRGTGAVEKTLRENYSTWSATASDGASGTANTTAITLTFSPAFSGLTVGDITIANGNGSVTQGSWGGTGDSGATYTVAVTTSTQGNITVSVQDKGETAFGPDETVTVAVYKDDRTVDVRDTQSGVPTCGTAGTATFPVTTTLFTDGDYPVVFSVTVPNGVTVGDNQGNITITGNSGTLTLNTSAATPTGNHSLKVRINGIESGTFTLTVAPKDISTATGITISGDTASMPVGGQFVFTFPEKMDTATTRTVTLRNTWDGTTVELTGYFLNDSVTFVVDYRRLDYRTAYTLALSGFYDKTKLYIYEQTFAFVTQDYPPAPAIVRYITLPAVSGVATQPAAGSHQVWSGKDFVFTLAPPAGMVPHVSTDRLLGGARTPETLKGTQHADGSYTFVIRDVRENITVSITFATGNEAIGAASLKVWPNPVPRGGTARLEYNAPDNTEVRIYTAQGALVNIQQLQNGQATLTFPPSAGIYIVRIGSATAKVTVK